MVIESQKICPLILKICEQEQCGWWNAKDNNCSIITIANSLNNLDKNQKESVEINPTDGYFK